MKNKGCNLEETRVIYNNGPRIRTVTFYLMVKKLEDKKCKRRVFLFNKIKTKMKLIRLIRGCVCKCCVMLIKIEEGFWVIINNGVLSARDQRRTLTFDLLL